MIYDREEIDMKSSYKICFVGLGSIAAKHIDNLIKYSKEIGFQITFYSVRSNKSSHQYDFKDIEINEIETENIDSFKFDCVFITNPTSLHVDSLKLFQNASNWFFVEKPLTNIVNHFIEIPNGIKNNIYVAAPLRHSILFKKIKDFVETNPFYLARVICSSYMPDWQPNRDYKYSYRNFSEMGGGVDIDLIHELDYVVDLFGTPIEIKKVSGHYSDLHGDSNDVALYILVYKKFLVEIHLDYFGKYSRRSIEFFTSEDLVVFDYLANTVNHLVKDENHKILPNDHYFSEIVYFFNLMDGIKSNINDVDNAFKVLKIAKV